MNLNLKGWQKVSSADDHTVMRNDKGHELKVSHKPLSKQMRKTLDGLPMAEGGMVPVKKENYDESAGAHNLVKNADPEKRKKVAETFKKMASGGEVEQKKEPEPVVINIGAQGLNPNAPVNPQMPAQGEPQQPIAPPQAPQFSIANAVSPMVAAMEAAPPEPTNGVIGEKPKESAPLAEAQQPQPSVNAPQSAPQATIEAPAATPLAKASVDPYGYTDQQLQTEIGIESQRQGLAGQAEAEGDLGNAQAKLLHAAAAREVILNREFMSNARALESARQTATKALEDKKIDPQQYWNSKSAPGKVASIIGLILGGVGSGILRQENPALKYLNQQIDNDVKAQQAEIGKRENLLAANMRQFGNMRDAMDMTRVMQSDIAAHQMKEAAAIAQDPMAKARLAQAAGQLFQQNAPVLQQMAMRKTLLGGANSGRLNPEMVIRAIVPEGERQSTLKELKEAQTAYRARDNAFTAFDQVSKMNTIGNRGTSPLQAKRQIDAIWKPVVAAMSKETAGRFTEQDAEMLDTLKPGVGENANTLQAKRAAMQRLMSEKLHFPALKIWNIDPSGGARYDNLGRPRVQESAPVIK